MKKDINVVIFNRFYMSLVWYATLSGGVKLYKSEQYLGVVSPWFCFSITTI